MKRLLMLSAATLCAGLLLTGCTAFINKTEVTTEEKVTTLAQLLADICEGRVTLPSLNVKRLGVWGENNLIVTGSGAPLTPPDRAGQIYIDTTNNAQYNSAGNNSVSDWKIQN